MANLTKRSNGVYYFRARVPTRLVSAYGHAMVSHSLGTTDKSEANRRARVHREQLDKELEELGLQSRKVAEGYQGVLLHLTDSDIENICLRYRASKFAADELERIGGIGAMGLELDLGIYELGVRNLRAAYAQGRMESVYTSLNEFLRGAGLRIPQGTPPYRRLARAFQTAEIEVYNAILQRREGKSVDIPLEPLDSLSYDDVFNIWNKRRVRPAKTVRAFRQAFEELRSRCTATTAKMLTDHDAIAFRDNLLDGMSAKNTQKLISFLRAAFECARKDKKLTTNPFDGVEVTLDEKQVDKKSQLPFTMAELVTIFHGSVFKPGFVPRKSLGNACTWLPPLALYTGARLEELAQLEFSDVLHDKDFGPHIHIHRNVKTLSSVRYVPIHDQLVRLGFLEYVKFVKAGRLFPTLKPDKYGKLSTTYSTWFGRYLDRIGITDRQKVFHSFRHGFAELCKRRASIIDPEVREAMMGHVNKKKIVAMGYGNGMYPLDSMADAIKHFNFEGLDLSHLRLYAGV